MSKAKEQKSELENPEIHHDRFSVEAVRLILGTFLDRKYCTENVTEDMASFLSRNDDFLYDFRDGVYVVKSLLTHETVRVWLKQHKDSVVVELTHVIRYDDGLFIFPEGECFHRVKQLTADIGYFNVVSLRSVVSDFKAMVDDGPYSSEKTETADDEAFFHYGNIHRAKNLDGVKILQRKPEDYDDAEQILDDLYKEWRKEDTKRHE